MGKYIGVAATVVVGASVSGVINILSDGGAWWLWPVLVALVAIEIVIVIVRQRTSAKPDSDVQRVDARGGRVDDARQETVGGTGSGTQEIKVRKGGDVRNLRQIRSR
jgi:hypothetical protein